jgi:hypothetical protein
MPATKHDQANLDELIRAHTDRLRILQRQQARMGDDTPPHVVTEIERIDAELAQLKQAAALPISATLVEELGPTGRYQLWMSHIMRLDSDIGRLRRDLELDIQRIEGKLDQVLIALATKRPTRRRRKPSEGQR